MTLKTDSYWHMILKQQQFLPQGRFDENLIDSPLQFLLSDEH